MNQSTQVIINASAHEIPLGSGSVHAVVTSPPYYSLRKYQGEQEVDWPEVWYLPMPGIRVKAIEPMRCALGLEPTPEAYIGHMVLVFREVMRVLRDDGSCWVVIGDSYGNGGNGGNLMMIPHRLALALQADGWIVRNDVVWHKVAPMPESVSGWRWERCRVKVDGTRCKRGFPQEGEHYVGHGSEITDRPMAIWTDCPGCDKCREHGGYVLRRGSWRHTRAHETVLMLAKGMGYFADQERVRMPLAAHTLKHLTEVNGKVRSMTNSDEDWMPRKQQARCPGRVYFNKSGRNPRSVLTPKPESYPGAHYAVYPRTLISPLLQATAPTRTCPKCGAPWCPVVKRGEPVDRPDNPNPALPYTADSGHTNATGATTLHKLREVLALGYRPTCDCGREDWQPGWVLDPFVGSGTTLEVCKELGVNCVGLDISLDYLDQHAKPRIGLTPAGALETLPLFADIQDG